MISLVIGSLRTACTSVAAFFVIVIAVALCIESVDAKPVKNEVTLNASIIKRQTDKSNNAASAKIKIDLVRAQPVRRLNVSWENTSFYQDALPRHRMKIIGSVWIRGQGSYRHRAVLLASRRRVRLVPRGKSRKLLSQFSVEISQQGIIMKRLSTRYRLKELIIALKGDNTYFRLPANCRKVVMSTVLRLQGGRKLHSRTSIDPCSDNKEDTPPAIAGPIDPPGPVFSNPDPIPNPDPNPDPSPQEYGPKAICALCDFDFESENNDQVVSDVTADATLTVDPNADPVRNVPGALFGGNDMYTWNSFYLRDKEILKKYLPEGFTMRWHLANDSKSGQRWDDGQIEQGGGNYSYNLLNAEEYRSFAEHGSHSASLDQWKDSGSWIGNHSMQLKFNGEGEVYSAISADAFAKPGDKELPVYGRIDINPSAGLTVGDSLEILRFNFTDGVMRVVLTGEKHVALLKENGSTIAESAGPVQVGDWTSVEAGFTSSGAKLFIDGVNAGENDAGIDGALASYQVGHRIWGEQINGSLYIDEARIDEKQMGATVPGPVETVFNKTGSTEASVIDYFTFEGNQQTIDDRMQLVEELGAELVMQIPVSYDSDYPVDPSADADLTATPDQGEGFSWDTQIYWADLVEYITAEADPDFDLQVPPTDAQGSYEHSIASGEPGHYNWANLRARRGRVAPYALKRVEIGNEPYYSSWNSDLNRFAQKWADQAHLIRSVNPGLDLGLPVNQGIDETVFAAVSARRQSKYLEEALVGWVAIHQYSKLLLASDENQVPWWVGGWPVAVNWPGEPWEQGPFPQVENVTQQVSTSLSGESEFDKIDLGLTEFGFGISQFFVKRYNFMADAMMRASYIGSALDTGIEHAQTWGLLNDQGFAFGLIGQGSNYAASSTLPLSGARITGRQFTPSFHLYKMYGSLFGDQLLPLDFEGPTYNVDDLVPHWETPYISANATRDSASGDLTLAFINRDLSSNRVVDIDIPGSGFNTVQVAELKSTEPYDSNEEVPEKVVPSAYHFKINSPTFKFRLRRLSITFLRFKGQ